MMADKWEVVGRGAKKNKKVTQESKNANKKPTNFAKLNGKPDIKDSSIFGAFLLKERRDEERKAMEMNKKSNKENQVKKANQQQNQVQNKQNSKQTKQNKQVKNENKKENKKEVKKENKDVKKILSVDEAVSSINVVELSLILSSDRERFASMPLIWLKDLAAYLNLKLNVNVPDPVFAGKPLGYPYNLAPKPLKGLLNETYKNCPPAALKLFYEYSITNCIEDANKGLQTLGYRLVIQSLGIFMPSIVLNDLPKFKELLGKNENNSQNYLTILWSLGQCGVKNMEAGLKVWMDVMLPLLGVRAYSQYSVNYLDLLLTNHPNVIISSEMFGVRQFFPILDVIFAHGINFPLHLHKQILSVYPKLKKLVIGPEPDRVLRNFFPSFFIRLVPSASSELKSELLESLVNCLLNDHSCFSIWRQLHSKHLLSSSLLLEYLVTRWKSLAQRLPKQLLKTTLHSFQTSNDKNRSNNSNLPGSKKCEKSCRELLDKMKVPPSSKSAAMFPWRWFFFLSTVVLVNGILVYDIRSSGGFNASTTARWMNDFGVLESFNHGWSQVEKYSGITLEWSKKHIPVYWARVSEVCGPYVRLFWKKLYELSVFVVDNTEGIRGELNKRVPVYLQWINDNIPVLVQQQLIFLNDVWGYVSRYVIIAWTWICAACHNVADWMFENVLVGKLSPENLEKYTLDAIETMHGYTKTVYQWINQQISGLSADK